ncbi:GFA family protein [Erythrobacteraceae bacterium E2-1 Yellow Sea]|nr:GFA family protein [Erythrobacteraceae bacterium E2-1 Yellow Sea]
MSEAIREGGCGCGATKYRVTGEPIFVNNCHCRQCQQQTGSTSVVNAFYESERIEVLNGDLSEDQFVAGSGGPHVIVRCSACHTALWSHYPRLGRHGLGLRAGTLDDPGSITPDAVIWLQDKMPWVALPDGIPHFDQYYDFREVLPQDRQERLLALATKAKG